MPKIIFYPFPELNTERLHLRQLSLNDEPEILELRDHEQVLQYIDRPKVRNLAGARDFIQYINNGITKEEWFYWGISLAGRDQLVGTICLWHFNSEQTETEIGYELHPDFQGKGLMRETVQAIIDFAFHTLNIETIKAYTHTENQASIALLEKCGFRFKAYAGIYSLFLLEKNASYPSTNSIS